MKNATFNRGILAILLCVLIAVVCVGLVACSNDNATPQNSTDSSTHWYCGTDTPTTQGVSGDFYIDTDDYILYQKNAGKWSVVMENFGKPVQSDDTKTDGGTTWFCGTDINSKKSTIYATVANSKTGDMYLNTKTADVYKCKSDGVWSFVMNLSVNQEKQEWNEDGVLKILSIGNSFSVDTQQYAYQIAKSLGVEKVVLGNLYIGGCTLSTHLANARYNTNAYTYYTNEIGAWKETSSYTIEEAVLSDNWDYITFQQSSGLSGKENTYDDLQKLMDIVSPLQPKAKLVWLMTWAYQGDSNNVNFASYNNDQMTMYNAITSAVQAKVSTNDEISIVIPVATAIQNARTSSVGDTLTRDGYHLSYDLGRYIAGLCFIHHLTGLSIDDITYKPSGVSAEQLQIAIESAKNSYTTPFAVTQSTYINA